MAILQNLSVIYKPNLPPEELVGMFFNYLVEPSESRKSFASLPYTEGVTEPLTRVLKK